MFKHKSSKERQLRTALNNNPQLIPNKAHRIEHFRLLGILEESTPYKHIIRY